MVTVTESQVRSQSQSHRYSQTQSQIRSNTVTESQVRSNTVTESQVRSNTVTESQVRSNTVTESQVRSNTVTESQVRSNTVTESQAWLNTVTGTVKHGENVDCNYKWLISINCSKYSYKCGQNTIKLLTGIRYSHSHGYNETVKMLLVVIND